MRRKWRILTYKPSRTGSLKVLLTNDDGYEAPGIRFLHQAMSLRHEVVVVAPKEEQSGVGHGFTYKRPLVCASIPHELGMQGFSVSGSPSDCVKIAIAELLPWKPDVVVSGLNAGDNTGIAAFYSGTVAGAREGAFWRIPSYAFSVAIGGEKHMEQYSRMAVNIMRRLNQQHHVGFDPERAKTFFNVNFPSLDPAKAKATKYTRQSLAFYKDRYEVRTTGSGETEYLLTGELVDVEKSNQFDARAISEGYITITPLSYDSTQVGVLNEMTYDAELDWHVQESLL